MGTSITVGTSSWADPGFVEEWYPEGLPARDRLPYYAERFDAVEVNSTFYAIPDRRTLERWLTQTPDDFLFTVKASRYLTHIKRLTDLPAAIGRFYERIEPLVESPKMGPVLWQLPGNFHRDDERLAGALRELPAGRHAFEFRHASWFDADVMSVLREHGAALVIGDHPERPFQSRELTADFTIVRFHWGARGRRGNYSEAELETWKRRIAAWRRKTEVLVYLNNDWEAFAVRNARWLRKRLS